MTAARQIAGRAGRGVLLIADHASADVPPDIDLGVAAAVMAQHVALDIGSAALAEGLAARLGAAAIIAAVSRLVIDLNRDPADAGAVPAVSDGIAIPGNDALGPAARARRAALHQAYHSAIEAALDGGDFHLILSLHSFTPALASEPGAARPWHAGLLYDRDDRAARLAIDWLRADGLNVGDNQPYCGRRYGYTVQRHAEPRGIPYLMLEIRQDQLGGDVGVRSWIKRLASLAEHVEKRLASGES